MEATQTLELTVDSNLVTRVKDAIIVASGATKPAFLIENYNDEESSFLVTGIPTENQGDVEEALLSFGNAVEFGWH